MENTTVDVVYSYQYYGVHDFYSKHIVCIWNGLLINADPVPTLPETPAAAPTPTTDSNAKSSEGLPDLKKGLQRGCDNGPGVMELHPTLSGNSKLRTAWFVEKKNGYCSRIKWAATMVETVRRDITHRPRLVLAHKDAI